LRRTIFAFIFSNFPQLWNAFYNENRIIGSEREANRLVLTRSVARVLENGLNLLGIEAPEKM
jgi:arginyl-tRNA synthetase